MQAIAQAVEDEMKKLGDRPLGVEGVSEGRWALVDLNDVVMHVFHEPVRAFYNIEGLWAEAPMEVIREDKKITGRVAKAAEPAKAKKAVKTKKATVKPKAAVKKKPAAKAKAKAKAPRTISPKAKKTVKRGK